MIEYNGHKIALTEIDNHRGYNLSNIGLKNLNEVLGLEGDVEVEYLDIG